jgi:steroid 5-alpha reductase family enzyme
VVLHHAITGNAFDASRWFSPQTGGQGMTMLDSYLDSLLVMLVLGFATWTISLVKKDVSIVDSLWSLMFLGASLFLLSTRSDVNLKNLFILSLVMIWALRLSIFLTIRNWGEPEDRRYRQIRANNSPNFALKSLFIIFALQAVIASIVFTGLLPGLSPNATFHWLDVIALLLWITGFIMESLADQQLYRFKKQSAPGDVLQAGLWRYSRHPNYFGEFLIWWAFFLMTVTQGYWWVIFSPLVMTLLLLKVSGVGLMEQGISARRPAYQAYIERTSVFFPWLPRKNNDSNAGALQ